MGHWEAQCLLFVLRNRTFVLLVKDDHDFWWLVCSGSVLVGPEVAGEADLGRESPATGWAQVGGCGAWDAGNSRLSQFAFLLCFRLRGPVLLCHVGSFCEEDSNSFGA